MPSWRRCFPAVLFVTSLVAVHGICYLEDTSAGCPVCWKTVYANEADKLGVTTASECPDGISEKWEVPLPETMVEMFEYPVEFSIAVDGALFPVREKGDDPHVPHANIHSCIASRGACTPFVSNTPGLSTHTPALKASMDADGFVKFSTTVRLTEEQYTIIAHIRFYVADEDQSKPLVKYDAAIGIARAVMPQTVLCDPGSVYNQTTEECDLCPAGTSQVKLECLPCPAGTHAIVAGLATCVPCTRGYTNNTGQVECEECPANTQRVPGTPGISKLECVCKYGFYNKYGPGEPCEPCPAGAICEGETAKPYPRPGYWGYKDCNTDPACGDYDTFFQCVPQEDCLGGKDFACKEGHMGRMCREAEDDYFVVGGQFWFECGKQGVLVNVLGIVGVCAIWIGINSVAAGNYDALDIALLYVQITGMVASYGMRWHNNVGMVNTVLRSELSVASNSVAQLTGGWNGSIVNFDVDFVAPMSVLHKHGCIGKWTQVHAFYTQLFLPVLYSGLHGLLLLVRSLPSVFGFGAGPRRTLWQVAVDAENSIFNHGMSFCIIVFHTLCLKCFSVYLCQAYPDGNSYMVFAPEVQCWDKTHIGMVVTASLYIPLVLVGLPVFMFWVVSKAMKEGTLHDKNMIAKYCFFYSRYDTEYKWWECMIVIRRMSIALVSVVVDTSMLQASLTIVILLVLLNLHSYTKPFVSDKIDFLEVARPRSIHMACIIHGPEHPDDEAPGMLFYPSITNQAQGELCVGDLGAVNKKACEAEDNLKMIIGVILLVWFGATLLVAFVVAGISIVEINRQEKARKIVKEVLLLDREDESVEGDSCELAREEAGSPLTQKAAFKRVASFKTWRSEGSHVSTTRMISASANQLALHDLLNGKLLLEWAKQIRESSDEEQRTVIDEWNYVGSVINSMKHDVTHYSTSNIASTMRIMTQLPELEDWLCAAPAEDREALQHVVERYSAFLDKAGNTKTRYHAAEMVELEYKPVMLCAMMTCTPEQHRMLTSLLDKILSASDEEHRTRQRSQSFRSLLHSKSAKKLVLQDAPTRHTSESFRSALSSEITFAAAGVGRPANQHMAAPQAMASSGPDGSDGTPPTEAAGQGHGKGETSRDGWDEIGMQVQPQDSESGTDAEDIVTDVLASECRDA